MTTNYVVCDVCDRQIMFGEQARFYSDKSRDHPLITECHNCVDFNLLENVQPLDQEQYTRYWNHQNLMNHAWCQRCQTELKLGDKAVIPTGSVLKITGKGQFVPTETCLMYSQMLCPPCALKRKNHTATQEITQQIIDEFQNEMEDEDER